MWTASTDNPDSYNVYKGTAPGNEGATPLNSTPIVGTTYSDSSVQPGQQVSYVVTAVKSGVESAHSNEVIITVPTAVAAPSGLVAIAISN
jgi:hypothetical protein